MLATIRRKILNNITFVIDNSLQLVVQRFRPQSLQYALPISFQEDTQAPNVSIFDQAALWFAAPKSKVFCFCCHQQFYFLCNFILMPLRYRLQGSE